MKRAMALVFLLLVSHSRGSDPQPSCEVVVTIGTGPTVEVYVPCLDKEQISELVTTLFAKGDEKAQAKYRQIVGKAKRVTLTLESE